MNYHWYVRRGDNKFCTLGGFTSRGIPLDLIGWVPDIAMAEPFDKWEHARDFIHWLGLSDTDSSVHIVDYAVHPPLPPDADETPVKSWDELMTEVRQNDRKAGAIRAANWKLVNPVAICLAFATTLMLMQISWAMTIRKHWSTHVNPANSSPWLPPVPHVGSAIAFASSTEGAPPFSEPVRAEGSAL
jgi:hypothetical protein